MRHAASGGAAHADTGHEISAAARISISCVYRILKSNPRFRSIAAYSVDGFRNALEFTIQAKDGYALTMDILISGSSKPAEHPLYLEQAKGIDEHRAVEYSDRERHSG